MERSKGGKNREWSEEEKLKYVLMVLTGEKSEYDIQKNFCIFYSMVRKWVYQYNEGWIDALQSKHKPGNPLAKYSRRKELSDIEQLEYENIFYNYGYIYTKLSKNLEKEVSGK